MFRCQSRIMFLLNMNRHQPGLEQQTVQPCVCKMRICVKVHTWTDENLRKFKFFSILLLVFQVNNVDTSFRQNCTTSREPVSNRMSSKCSYHKITHFTFSSGQIITYYTSSILKTLLYIYKCINLNKQDTFISQTEITYLQYNVFELPSLSIDLVQSLMCSHLEGTAN